MLGTPSLLRLLQVQPLRGRLFTEEDGEVGKTRKVVLTYARWQQLFGGRDNAIGQRPAHQRRAVHRRRRPAGGASASSIRT